VAGAAVRDATLPNGAKYRQKLPSWSFLPSGLICRVLRVRQAIASRNLFRGRYLEVIAEPGFSPMFIDLNLVRALL
jgi:hypothetical protein